MFKSEVIKKLQSHFDSLVQTTPEEGIEFWFARDLQEPLARTSWICEMGKFPYRDYAFYRVL
ncbi:MAG TPA: hypothetical protein VJK48_00650 [Chlamydiales bacterium]|nr:hypothetical protein [Chlamydiales bacterium]